MHSNEPSLGEKSGDRKQYWPYLSAEILGPWRWFLFVLGRGSQMSDAYLIFESALFKISYFDVNIFPGIEQCCKFLKSYRPVETPLRKQWSMLPNLRYVIDNVTNTVLIHTRTACCAEDQTHCTYTGGDIWWGARCRRNFPDLAESYAELSMDNSIQVAHCRSLDDERRAARRNT